MKIAVSATNGSLDAQVDPRLGRCAWFVVVDGETLDFEALENAAATAGAGAGIRAARAVATAGAEAVVAGNYSHHAFDALSRAGIRAYLPTTGSTVRQAVEAFNAGDLQLVEGPTASGHAHTGGGGGRGAGARGGHGACGCHSRGMGAGGHGAGGGGGRCGGHGGRGGRGR